MRIQSIFEQLQHCILRTHLSPADGGSSKIGCLCSSEETQAVVSNCCDIRQGNHPAAKVLLFTDYWLFVDYSVYWLFSLLQWHRRLKMRGVAHESGEATVSTQGKAVCMGGIRKPLLPPLCTAGSSTVRQGALCSLRNFIKSQRCLCLSGLSQFTFLKHCLHLNPY